MHPTYVASNNTVNWCLVAWCTQNVCRDGSSFTLHQPHNNQTALLCKLTTLVDIQQTCCVYSHYILCL